MSALLSPSKSPEPTTFQAKLFTVDAAGTSVELPDLQITFAPLERLRHRMSDNPSPLKSLRAVPPPGTLVSRNVAMIGITWFRLRTLSDWFATPVARLR